MNDSSLNVSMAREGETESQRIKRIYTRRYLKQKSLWEKSSWLRQFLISWVEPMIEISAKIPFSNFLFYDLRERETAEYMSAQWDKQYREVLGSQGSQLESNPVMRVLLSHPALIPSVVLSTLHSILQLVSVYLLFLATQSLVAWSVFAQQLSDEGETPNPTTAADSRTTKTPTALILYSTLLAVSLTAAAALQTHTQQLRRLLQHTVGSTLRAAVSRHVLHRLSAAAAAVFDGAEMLGFGGVCGCGWDGGVVGGADRTHLLGNMAGDEAAGRCAGEMLVGTIAQGAAAAAGVLFAAVGLAVLFGPAIGGGGFVAVVGVVAVGGWVRRRAASPENKLRNQIHGEIITGIVGQVREIQAAGLESRELQKIKSHQESRIQSQTRESRFGLASDAVVSFGTSLVLLFIFSICLYSKRELELEIVFPGVILIWMIVNWCSTLEIVIISRTQISRSLGRIHLFLSLQGINEEVVDAENERRLTGEMKKIAISIKKGNFLWIDHILLNMQLQEKSRLGSNDPKNSQPGSSPNLTTTVLKSNDILSESLLEDSEPDTNPLSTTYAPSTPQRVLTLRNLNLNIQVGATIGIVGRPGSGKSSLLRAILGQLQQLEGTLLRVRGSTSLVTTHCWPFRGSIRDSISFGTLYDHERFIKVINIVRLEQELADLRLARQDHTPPHDGETVADVFDISADAVNGTAHLKIEIARALYCMKDIVLFDDVWSHLKEPETKQILHEGIFGLLQGKTRLVVTNFSDDLEKFDHLIVMEGGEIGEEGSYHDLLTSNGLEFLKERSTVSPQEFTSSARLECVPSIYHSHTQNRALIEQQIAPSKPSPSSDTDSSTTGLEMFQWTETSILLILLISVWIFATFSLDWLPQYWADEFDNPRNISLFVRNFVLLAVCKTLSSALIRLLMSKNCAQVAKELNFQIAFRVLHASVHNLEHQLAPGQVQNTLGSDPYVVGHVLPRTAAVVVETGLQTLLCVGVMFYMSGSRPFVLLSLLLGFLYLGRRLVGRYLGLVLQVALLREETVAVSERQFADAVGGVVTIQAYKQQARFVQEMANTQDTLSKQTIYTDAALRWLEIRLQGLVLLIVLPAVLIPLWSAQSPMSLSVGMFALLLKLVWGLPGTISRLAESLGELCSAVQVLSRSLRVSQVGCVDERYSEIALMEERYREGFVRGGLGQEAASGPGEIALEGVSIFQADDAGEGGELLAKKESIWDIEISGGQTVAVEWNDESRRLFDFLSGVLVQYSGSARLDARELRDLDIGILRSQITVLSRRPYLTQDSLRKNLDPFGCCSDEELLFILRTVELWKKFESAGLDATITPSQINENEAKLLTISRGLLSKAKVILIEDLRLEKSIERSISQLLHSSQKDKTILIATSNVILKQICTSSLTFSNQKWVLSNK